MSDTSMFEIALADGVVPVLAYDTETSGTDPKQDHIITWGTSSIDDPEFEGIMQLPEYVTELDEGNIAVHGYTVADIKAKGVPRIEGLKAQFKTLDDFNENTRGFIVGHNVVYDMTILSAELAREGLVEESKKVEQWRILDTYPLLESTELIGMFNMVLKLFHIAELLGVDEAILKNAHNAGADSRVAAALLERMTMYFPSLLALTRDGLNEYMHKIAISAQYRKMAIFEEDGLGYPVVKTKAERDAQRKGFNKTGKTSKATRKPSGGDSDKGSERTASTSKRKPESSARKSLKSTGKTSATKTQKTTEAPRSRSQRTGNTVSASGRAVCTARVVKSTKAPAARRSVRTERS